METSTKALLLALCILPLALTGCLQLIHPPGSENSISGKGDFSWNDVDSVEGVYHELVRQDQFYQVDYRVERLDKTIVSNAIVDSMLSDLDVLLRKLDDKGIPAEQLAQDVQREYGTPDESEQDKMLLFVHTRRLMLESEKEWQMGYGYGNTGLVRDGFKCIEKDIVNASLSHFFTAAKLAGSAQYYLDILLSSVPQQTAELIGINKNKIAWYTIPLQKIFSNIKYERSLLDKHCTGGNTSNVMVKIGSPPNPEPSNPDDAGQTAG
ncbi:hypothetical protein HYU19_02480 [Candidatus Woesearchaeota archaeon]|nr:hypothetical protein [Candidatus Woesearchaeota archaeon]